MKSIHQSKIKNRKSKMTSGFICALFLALTVSMVSCNKDKNTGTIILRNNSEYTIKFWIPHKSPSGDIHDQYDVYISSLTGEDKRNGIPAGKYWIYVSVTDYPYSGGDSPVFEVKAGKTTTVHFLDVGFYGEWEVVDPK